MALPSLQLGCSLSWALPRRPINTGKEKRSQIVPWTDCRTLSPGTPASWETRLVYGCGWEEGKDDLSAFSHNQIWQFPTQGSRELTYAEYQVLQVESDLWVRQLKPWQRLISSVSWWISQAHLPVSPPRAKLVETGGLGASGPFLIP